MKTGAGRTVRLATRRSPLAMWQVRHVAALLERLSDGLSFNYVPVSTSGDGAQDRSIAEIGGSGVFTKELEDAIRAGLVDGAVHSLKDLPTEDIPGIVIPAVCAREDARDVLVARSGYTLDSLPFQGRVGTSSARRAAQLRSVRPDLLIAPIRGNVETRIRKVHEGEFDAAVLAAAGITRLHLEMSISQFLPVDLMIPAPGQGALAVQCREDDDFMVELLSGIDDPVSRSATTAERAFLHAVGGGCSAPVAAYALVSDDVEPRLRLRGAVLAPDGSDRIDVEGEGTMSDARVLGNECAERALARGAGKWLR